MVGAASLAGVRARCRRCGVAWTGDLVHVPADDVRDIGIDADGQLRYEAGVGRVDPGGMSASPQEALGIRLFPGADDLVGVAHPGDTVHLRWGAASTRGCCGEDARNGPNVECTGCGALAGVMLTDCWTATVMYFDPAMAELEARGDARPVSRPCGRMPPPASPHGRRG